MFLLCSVEFSLVLFMQIRANLAVTKTRVHVKTKPTSKQLGTSSATVQDLVATALMANKEAVGSQY